MRKNHLKRTKDPYARCDVVYVDLPQIRGVYRLDVLPLKTIYYNRAADDRTHYCRVFDDVDAFESFCDKHDIKVW